MEGGRAAVANDTTVARSFELVGVPKGDPSTGTLSVATVVTRKSYSLVARRIGGGKSRFAGSAQRGRPSTVWMNVLPDTTGRCVMRWTVLVLALAVEACSDGPLYPLAEAEGIDAQGLEAAVAWARDAGSVHSLLVERNGVLVAEAYFHGFDRDSLNVVWSVTKSFTSTLIGIAVDEGAIGSVDDPVGPYLTRVVPDLSPQKQAITIRQLLTMSSGIPWVEGGLSSEYTEWMASPNQVRYYLEKPVEHEPGTYFDYSDGGAHLAGVVLQEAVGMSSHAYASSRLFGPLAFEEAGWAEDKQGFSLGGVGLLLKARDMVKLGRLFLDRGAWNGAHVVSPTWVDEATAAQISWDNESSDPSRGYGYFWWVYRCLGGPCFQASGYGGQVIVVVPHKQLVVVATSEWSGGRAAANESWDRTDHLIQQLILPLVR